MKSNDRSLSDLDLNKLETFFTIVQAGGVSAAARRLALTRSAVSHGLTSLERSLGVSLFHRVGRRLVLTPEGARLRSAFAEVREQLAAALGDVTSAGAAVRGTVRLGLFLGFSRVRIAGVLERFVREHPDVRVRVRYGPQADLLERLLEGELDFTLSLRSIRRASPQVKSTRLFEQSLVLASSTRRRRLGFQELAALPIVDYYRSDPLIDRWSRHHFGRTLPRGNVRVWAASTDLVLELVRSGVGVGVLPRDLVEPSRRRGELAVVEGPGRPLRDFLWLNELAGARPGLTLRTFREVLLEK